QLLRRAQACVEVGGRELDIVAEALRAEADVQRHHAPVREALRRLRKVRGRIDDDRGVRARQFHAARAPTARRIAATISSSSWSFDRHATAPASWRASTSRRLADAVRQTT